MLIALFILANPFLKLLLKIFFLWKAESILLCIDVSIFGQSQFNQCVILVFA